MGPVKLSRQGLNFSATFRSEAEEKFKVEKEGVLSYERMRYIKNKNRGGHFVS